MSTPTEYLVELIFDATNVPTDVGFADPSAPKPAVWAPLAMTIRLSKDLQLTQPAIVAGVAPFYLELVKRSSGRLALHTRNERLIHHMARPTQVRLYVKSAGTGGVESKGETKFTLAGTSSIDEERLYTPAQAAKVAFQGLRGFVQGAGTTGASDAVGDVAATADDPALGGRLLAALPGTEVKQDGFKPYSIPFTMQYDGLQFPKVFGADKTATLLVRGSFSPTLGRRVASVVVDAAELVVVPLVPSAQQGSDAIARAQRVAAEKERCRNDNNCLYHKSVPEATVRHCTGSAWDRPVCEGYWAQQVATPTPSEQSQQEADDAAGRFRILLNRTAPS